MLTRATFIDLGGRQTALACRLVPHERQVALALLIPLSLPLVSLSPASRDNSSHNGTMAEAQSVYRYGDTESASVCEYGCSLHELQCMRSAVGDSIGM